MHMKLSISRRLFSVGAIAAASIFLVGVSDQVAAQTFPKDKITLIVPYAPGASGDIQMRSYAEFLGKELGVPIVVRNTPGGSGSLGTVQIFTAKPDGYTIGYGHNSPLAIQPHTNPNLPYKSIDDFTAIGGIGHEAGTVSVRGDAKWKSFAEFVAAAKADPGKISVAVGGIGNVKDLQLQQFEKAAGVDFNITPFSGGGAEAVAALLGGHVNAVSVAATSVKGQIASGDIRPLAIFADTAESEINGFKVVNAKDYPGMVLLQDSFGIIAPARVPADVTAVLEKAHQAVMKNEGYVGKLKAGGLIVDPAPSAQYKAQLKEDLKNFGASLGK
jgi:tripartite-type tricarboxylate transporter receptor subunit TctC